MVDFTLDADKKQGLVRLAAAEDLDEDAVAAAIHFLSRTFLQQGAADSLLKFRESSYNTIQSKGELQWGGSEQYGNSKRGSKSEQKETDHVETMLCSHQQQSPKGTVGKQPEDCKKLKPVREEPYVISLVVS